MTYVSCAFLLKKCAKKRLLPGMQINVNQCCKSLFGGLNF